MISIKGKRKSFIIILVMCSLAYGAIFTTLNILKYKSFFSFEWEDEAANNQLICNTSKGDILHQTVFINKRFFGHFTLIYLIIALFYKIYPGIYAWYFIMSFSYGFCSLIVFLLAKDILKSERIAFILSLSYLLYSPLHYVNLGTLDGNTFSLPLLFLTFYFMHKKKFIPYLIFMVLSCMCKEDIPLIIFTLGLYQLIKRYPKKWWGTTLVWAGGYFLVSVYLLNTFFHMKGFNSNITDKDFCYLDTTTLRGFLSFVFFNTKEFLKFIFIWSHIRVILMFAYPLFFLPLLGIEMYIPFFMLGEILISTGAYNNDSYYLAPIIPFLFVSLILVLKFILKHLKYKKTNYIVLGIILLCSLSNFGRNIIGYIAPEHSRNAYDKRFWNVKNIFDSRFYTMDREDELAWELIKMIPKGASVTASGDLLPALSCREVLYEFGLNDLDAEEHQYTFSQYPNYNVDYVIVNTRYLANGLSGDYAFFRKKKYLYKEIDNFIGNYHFSIINRKGGFILLKRMDKAQLK